jgi:diguanylate cyclase (GGDEF)-like protein/PAS domain S-box-containing protein
VARAENHHQTDPNLTGDRFHPLVDHSPAAIWVLQDGRIVYSNLAAVRCLAAQTREQLDGHLLTDFVDPQSIPTIWARIAELRQVGETSEPFMAQIVRLDGSTISVEAVSVLTLWDGEPAHQVVLRDVGAQKPARDPPHRAAHPFSALVELLDDGVVVLRKDGYIRFTNPAAMRIVGLRPEHPAADFARWTASLPIYDVNGEPVPPQLRPVAQLFRTGVAFSKQIFGTDLPNGERKWMLASGRLLNPNAPEDSDMLFSFSDITAERAELERLVYQANHDPLTGLPNRGFVLRRITDSLAATERWLRAVLFIDLDDLKTTNDSLGHDAGDELLRAAAARLRQTAGPADVVGRHGGDEFVVLIFGTATRGELNALVERLRSRLAEPVVVADTTTPIRASVGLVEVHRDDERTAEEILRDADRAMYTAKRAGRGDWVTHKRPSGW